MIGSADLRSTSGELDWELMIICRSSNLKKYFDRGCKARNSTGWKTRHQYMPIYKVESADLEYSQSDGTSSKPPSIRFCIIDNRGIQDVFPTSIKVSRNCSATDLSLAQRAQKIPEAVLKSHPMRMGLLAEVVHDEGVEWVVRSFLKDKPSI
jgi:hypothetical protein